MLKKFSIFSLMFLLMTVLFACIDGIPKDPSDNEVSIESIEINLESLQESYAMNELDLSTIELIVYYSDDTIEVYPLDETFIVIEYRALLTQIGTHFILVVYENEYTTFTIRITESVYEDLITLNFYYLNDLHGALLPALDEMGMAYIGNFLMDEKTKYPENTIILAGGDMLQGKLISNYYYGSPVVEIMDMIGFDAAAVGNHEFDWGIEMITRYYLDDVTEGIYQAQHPFLAANIVYKGTNIIPEGITPYTIIERSGLRIGIIGTIGYGLESSIAAHRVEDYQFLDPVPIARNYARYLRTEENVDIVVLLSHDSGQNLNSEVAYFEGDERIDAVFNGHSHGTGNTIINGMPTLISSSEGKRVGHIQLIISQGEIIEVSSTNYARYQDDRLQTVEPTIQTYLDQLLVELEFFYEVLMVSKSNYSQSDLTLWKARLLLASTGADFAFHNSGGTRATLYQGQPISLAEMENIFPFDNAIITATVSGTVVLNMMQYYGTASNHVGTINTNATYTIATNSYIFYSPFNSALQESDDIIIRYNNVIEVMFDEILLQAEIYPEFDINNPILIGSLPEYGSHPSSVELYD